MAMRTAATIVLLGVLASSARADTVVETFTDGVNLGGWDWGFGNTIEASGGNPGAYLEVDGLDSPAAKLRTTVGGPFIGDYRAMGVNGIDADLVSIAVGTTAGRPLTLMLIHDNDTPGNPLDDTAAYFLGPNMPHTGEGWLSYHYDVPAAETDLPAGWQLLDMGDSGNPDPTHDWDQVIQHVSQVMFHCGDPTFFFILQQWTMGADNIALCADTGPACPADVNGDGAVGVEDLTAVILDWAMSESPADVNQDGIVGVEDLTAVILAWGPCEG